MDNLRGGKNHAEGSAHESIFVTTTSDSVDCPSQASESHASSRTLLILQARPMAVKLPSLLFISDHPLDRRHSAFSGLHRSTYAVGSWTQRRDAPYWDHHLCAHAHAQVRLCVGKVSKLCGEGRGSEYRRWAVEPFPWCCSRG